MSELRPSDELIPGLRVRVTKQVARTQKAFVTTVEGVIRRHEQAKTGSWYAHAKDEKLWLDRLEIVKDDGEVYTCNIDAHTRIEVVPPPTPPDAPIETGEPAA
ncbi:MAG: hypothetical protein AAGC44_13500 [Planctomycetota bacterium]